MPTLITRYHLDMLLYFCSICHSATNLKNLSISEYNQLERYLFHKLMVLLNNVALFRFATKLPIFESPPSEVHIFSSYCTAPVA